MVQELKSFPGGPELWSTLPGVSNSAGNLVLHLEGNLREYVGRQMGHVPYQRQRPLEFSPTGIPLDDLIARMESVAELIPAIVAALPENALESLYPENVFGSPMTVRYFLFHLFGHLSYHLGQINYLRRIVTGQSA